MRIAKNIYIYRSIQGVLEGLRSIIVKSTDFHKIMSEEINEYAHACIYKY